MQVTKVKDLLNHKRDMLIKESIFTGNARVNRPGSVSDNVAAHIQHLKDYGHEILGKSNLSPVVGEHIITSMKDGKVFSHTLKPHGDGKWTTVTTTVKKD
jgi:hypothetical protein